MTVQWVSTARPCSTCRSSCLLVSQDTGMCPPCWSATQPFATASMTGHVIGTPLPGGVRLVNGLLFVPDDADPTTVKAAQATADQLLVPIYTIPTCRLGPHVHDDGTICYPDDPPTDHLAAHLETP